MTVMKRCTYGDHMAPLTDFRNWKKDGKVIRDSWCRYCRRENNADNYASGKYRRTPEPDLADGIWASRILWCGWRSSKTGGRPKGRRLRICGVNDNAPLDARRAGGQPSRSTMNGGPPCVTSPSSP